ncbi:MAG: hypothetical protein ACO3VO_00290 [Ilumatobacteraceae bacterium]
MNPVANSKSVVSLSAAAGVASAGTHTVAIDCLGYDSVSIDVGYRSIAHTSAPSVVSIQHSDTDGSYGTISGLIQSTDYTVGGVANTATVNVTRFNLSTKDLKRYLQVSVTPSASATANASNNTIVVAARLGKGEKGAANATDANVTTFVSK